jgi:hypothetical protein
VGHAQAAQAWKAFLVFKAGVKLEKKR